MEDSVSKKYIKGFNAAYLIAEYKPKLMNTLLKSEINNDFMEGMRDGKLILDREITKVLSKKARLKELDNINIKNKDKDYRL